VSEQDDYAGLVTRAVAFAIDVAVIDLAAAIVAIVVGLGISAFDLPHDVTVVAVALGGVAFVAWWVGYFAMFWSTTGQTPGARVMGVQVVCARSGGALRVGSAILRLAGMLVAAIPFFAGFLLILVDDRRRGLQDRIASTLVVYAPGRARLS